MEVNKVGSKGSFIFIQSLLVGFFADIKSVNWGLVYGGFVDEGIMSMLYVVVLSLIVLFSIASNNKLHVKQNFTLICLASLLLGFYVFTQSFIGPPRTSFSMFLVFVIMALLIPFLVKVDGRIVLKSMMFFPCFAIFRLKEVFQPLSDWTDVISMDASYAFLVPVIASVSYMFLYYKEEKIWGRLCSLVLSAINFVYFFQILQFGSRGPILSVLLLIAFLIMIKVKEDQGVKVKKGWVSFIVGGLVVVYSFFLTFVGILGNVVASGGIQLHAVDKILRLGAEGDVSNGREAINAITVSAISNNPLVGYGLDRFEANTGIVYPHNFILQTLYDGGILLLIVLFVPVIRGSVRLLKRCDKDEYAVFVVFLFASVPGALFSGDMWMLSILWLFFGSVVTNKFVLKIKHGK